MLLSACGSIGPSGLAALARLDPLNSPAGSLAVAISVPENLLLSDGDAALTLAFSPHDKAQAAPVSTTLPLTIRTGADAPLARSAGRKVYVLGLSVGDAARFRRTQATIRSLRENAVHGQGSLQVSVTGGCLIRPLGEALPVATCLRPDPSAAFIPLTRETDLFDVLNTTEARALRARLGSC
ncbi:hypothetical protein AB2B41_08520 [Marimonas sp. MJW-29]|uniref:Lipoprotein n=1 Tax=Sulfitobacter sediminis TaxID=3234186 RepID=A0ABV3RMR2_9RHOB